MEKQKKLIEKALKNDEDAVRFVLDVMFVARIWDDIYDAPPGKRVPGHLVNQAFSKALVDIQANPFYRQYQDQFVALFREYAANWMSSNEFEKTGTEHEKTIAFVLRDTIGGLVLHCAYLIGGSDWMTQIAPEIRKLQFDEPLIDYLEGLGHGNLRNVS